MIEKHAAALGTGAEACLQGPVSGARELVKHVSLVQLPEGIHGDTMSSSHFSVGM